MTAVAYGPYVISDITHYADKVDLENLLKKKFPVTVAQPKPWHIAVDQSGDLRVWAPVAITQDEKDELYRKNEARREPMTDLLSLRQYKV